jgi:hypothetical protein
MGEEVFKLKKIRSSKFGWISWEKVVERKKSGHKKRFPSNKIYLNYKLKSKTKHKLTTIAKNGKDIILLLSKIRF